jgi:hypothetical protein
MVHSSLLCYTMNKHHVWGQRIGWFKIKLSCFVKYKLYIVMFSTLIQTRHSKQNMLGMFVLHFRSIKWGWFIAPSVFSRLTLSLIPRHTCLQHHPHIFMQCVTSILDYVRLVSVPVWCDEKSEDNWKQFGTLIGGC